jgi:hypothetical protein
VFLKESFMRDERKGTTMKYVIAKKVGNKVTSVDFAETAKEAFETRNKYAAYDGKAAYFYMTVNEFEEKHGK